MKSRLKYLEQELQKIKEFSTADTILWKSSGMQWFIYFFAIESRWSYSYLTTEKKIQNSRAPKKRKIKEQKISK